MSCCPDSPWSAEGGKGKGRERQNKGDPKVSKRCVSERTCSPQELLEGSSRARAGKGGRGRGKEGGLPAAAACLLFSSFVLGPRAPLNFPALAADDNFSLGTVKTPRARLGGALHPSQSLLPAPASAPRPSFAARLQQMRVKPTHRCAGPSPAPTEPRELAAGSWEAASA